MIYAAKSTEDRRGSIPGQLDELREWTERDGEIVEWIGRIGAAEAGHVARRFGMGRSRTYERLQALVSDGLLEQRTLLHRQPGLYLATGRGLRWRGLQRLGCHPLSPAGFEHARHVAAAAIDVEQELPHWQLLGEREIRRHELAHNHHRLAESRARPTNTAFERFAEREVRGSRIDPRA